MPPHTCGGRRTRSAGHPLSLPLPPDIDWWGGDGRRCPRRTAGGPRFPLLRSSRMCHDVDGRRRHQRSRFQRQLVVMFGLQAVAVALDGFVLVASSDDGLTSTLTSNLCCFRQTTTGDLSNGALDGRRRRCRRCSSAAAAASSAAVASASTDAGVLVPLTNGRFQFRWWWWTWQ